MPKKLPWFKWNDADFMSDPYTMRMQPATRSHLRTLIVTSLTGDSPWLKHDDDYLAVLSDCNSTEDFLSMKSAMLKAFVSSADGTEIAHPLALAISEDREERASQARTAAKSRYSRTTVALEDDDSVEASHGAQLLAQRVLEVRYENTPDDTIKHAAILDPLLDEHGYDEAMRVADWLVDSSEAESFYRGKQFAGCNSTKATLSSFVKSFDRMKSDAKKKPAAKVTAIDGDAIINKYAARG